VMSGVVELELSGRSTEDEVTVDDVEPSVI
jgi:hypothetical protein